ncbi:MAG: hypothetical protein HYT73_01670 [Candidatus Aenigmarchaeota archaeon]|nr:hypothetical protein [Candidatus Aenigmarchaeota archaeon]
MAAFPTQLFNLGFGDKANRQVSVALAFVIAFFVTGVGGAQLAAFFTNLFGGASVFLAGILVVVLFASMLWPGDKKDNWLHKSFVPLAAVILIGIALFLGSTGTLVGSVWLDSQTAVTLFWIIIIVVAIYLVTREKAEAAPATKP